MTMIRSNWVSYFVLTLALATPWRASAEVFKYDLDEAALKQAMTSKEADLYAKAEKVLSKAATEVGTMKILIKSDKSRKGALEAAEKAVTDSKSVLERVKTDVTARVESAIPSSKLMFAGVPAGMNAACEQLEAFATKRGITEPGFAGIVIWKDGKPQVNSALSEVIYARLSEGKLKWNRISLTGESGAPDVLVDSGAGFPAFALGEVVDAKDYDAKLISLRLIDAKRMAVIKSYSWLVPQKASGAKALRVMVNDERLLFYKSFVVAHEMKLVQAGVPEPGDAFAMAVAKQMLADCPNCELLDEAFVAALSGRKIPRASASRATDKAESTSIVSEKNKAYFQLSRAGGATKPVRVGGIEFIPAQ